MDIGTPRRLTESELADLSARLPRGNERYIERVRPELVELLAGTPSLPYRLARDSHAMFARIGLTIPERAFLGLIDRYYLLVWILGRVDLLDHRDPEDVVGTDDPAGNPWLYDRCREVEREPDGRLDLWARDHYKSTLITYAGVLQELLRDPELTVGIFSHTRPTAKKFLRQLKLTLETGDRLKAIYSDVLFSDPRGESPKWSEDEGLVIKRQNTPKEASIEAWGLVDGMPTGAHFGLCVFDDVVTDKSVTSPEMVEKTTAAYELADNLGDRRQRKWVVGTRYAFSDTYQTMIDRGSLIERIYPATDDGTTSGRPVFLTLKQWRKKLRDQPSQVPAQMLLNPAAGARQMFDARWFKGYYLRPERLTVWILVDPSKGRTERSDNTAMAVIGLDARDNRYLLDGARSRMNLAMRWETLKNLHRKWSKARGVESVTVGYEQYGLATDIEHFELMGRIQNYPIAVQEIGWVRESAKHSKADRVERLVPDLKQGRFLFPAVVWTGGQLCTWRVDQAGGIHYDPLQGEPREWREVRGTQREPLIVGPLRKLDQDSRVYDLTIAAHGELQHFPYGRLKDLADAMGRLYDLHPAGPLERDVPLEPDVHVDS